jgi:ABC-2 type transport system ATP-binding protein
VTAVSVKGLAKSYGALRALDDVSFEVAPGQVFALLGPNGAGKTTSIEILEGFISRDEGAVQVLGVDPGERHQQRWLRTRIGIVLQELAVEPYFTVRQVLERNAGFYPSPRPVGDVIELVGLDEKADKKVKLLSGGQQRRLDVGLGLIGNPEILFLDEPTTGLDPAARRTTWDLIRRLSSEGTTVLLSSHYMDEVEALAQNVAVLARGRIVATGPPSSLGGRDHGRVTIRFGLPHDVPADLPVSPAAVAGRTVEVITDDEVAVLARILNWALDRGVELNGLSVTRTTLEDIYLDLTRSNADEQKSARE